MRLEAATMNLFQKFCTARKLIIAVVIPLLLLPLPLIHPTSEASCAYVVIVTAVFWVFEAVPLGAAALIPAFLYPMFGVLKSSEVAAEYFKETTQLLIGVICLATSIDNCLLHKRVALRMVMIAGAKPGILVLGFMVCTAFLSMWLSNTSTTAMVMPLAHAVLEQLNATGLANAHDHSNTTEAPDDPQSSDKENMDKNELELVHRKDSWDKQEVRILTEVTTELSSGAVTSYPSQEFSTHTNGHLPQLPLEVEEGKKKEKERKDSPYPTKKDHMICKCLSLSITYAATIGGLMTPTGTSSNLIFVEQFNARYPDAKVINFGTWLAFSLPIACIMLLLTWLWLHCLFLGIDFRETCSLRNKHKTEREVMSERRIHDEYTKLGPISYPEVVTGVLFLLMTLLWFTREPGFMPGWASLFQKKGYRTDATVSVLLGFLLFVIPARRPFSSASKNKGQSSQDGCRDSDPLAPMITWKDFQKMMPWEIVILVGGGYALAAGCKVSGLSVWIGRKMEPMGALPPWAVTLIASSLVSVVTEFASNPATLTVFLPILSALSETLQIHPLYTLIPCTMCVSFGVMLPVGNPPNAIVFGYGHLQIRDMMKAGFGVNVIGVLVVMLAINSWGIPLFGLTEFPAWANVTLTEGL